MAEFEGEIKNEIEIVQEFDHHQEADHRHHIEISESDAGKGTVSADTNHHAPLLKWGRTLALAFQSIGVVYGDIGTSPLYVYSSTFTDGIHDKKDLIGVLSLIIYTLTLIPLVKYVFVVLWFNDNGEGGTFALYSLICRYTKIGLMSAQEPELPIQQPNLAYQIKEKLENNKAVQVLLFLVTIMGTSMVIGDGVLTPSISVLSAVSGIKSLGQDAIAWVSVAVLIVLFSAQRFGTDKVGFSFAPIILVWLLFISGTGLYNLFKHDIGVLHAFNPLYIIDYFKRNGKKGWISLGGVVLCMTGTEAMFADLGHFSVRAIQIGFSGFIYPALLLVYCGQTAYLSKHPEDVSNAFYASVPGVLYWPMFVVAVAASVIASQAMVSGTFSLVSQSLHLGCFPRVKIVHTSVKYKGQVYIPEINYLLMVACIFITLVLRTTEKIGNAYGIAVVTVMLITTFMVSLIMFIIWKTSIWWIVAFALVFGSMEVLYLSSVLYKFINGGFLPLALAVLLMSIMGIWHYVHVLKYRYELQNMVSSSFTAEVPQDPNINRVPGLGLFYTELVEGITPLFAHYISNVSSVHSVFVLVSIKRIPVSRVVFEDRYLFHRVEPKDLRMFRCVVRYGYKEDITEPHEFEDQLLHYLKEFIRHEYHMNGGESEEEATDHRNNASSLPLEGGERKLSSVYVEDQPMKQMINDQGVRVSSASFQTCREVWSGNSSPDRNMPAEVVELQQQVLYETELIENAREKGVVYLMGETEIMAENKSSVLKKFIINNAYNFLKRNCRQVDETFAISRSKLLRVGMTYEL